jgi:hypothetical protein
MLAVGQDRPTLAGRGDGPAPTERTRSAGEEDEVGSAAAEEAKTSRCDDSPVAKAAVRA